ncbi:DUF2721 domain-containing protein [Ramlibacter sp. USB13]|uniref:DUF2721 domain-containing protein n=1 Tax=Ramlibacter cellulosilyticus TaxID=2764187 RepID=A0A923MSA4_9BURK|nr:DUF2721 domain-containing protein [Ramlibacter cellulosilyticus]MBC5783274.1 DUF2721 domain-containing protein [Ramlibacter cellulosilyticus]
MAFPLDGSSITHGIQLAVAPVFLLTAVTGMIGAVAGRLARIIDRARTVEDRALTGTYPGGPELAHQELEALRVRGKLSNACIALLTTCAFLIGVTIIVLFLGETSGIQISRWAIGSFLLGVATFLAALLCFLAETFLATRILDFRLRPHGRGPTA